MNDAVRRLRRELELRQKRNPDFSARAFARWLGVSPAQLSQVLSGKRPLTLKTAAKISVRLGLSPRDRTQFLSASSREVATQDTSIPASRVLELEEDRFKVISDWHHFAILSLTALPNAKDDPRWIAQRLGIAVAEANAAVGRLRRLELLSPAPQFRQIGHPLRVSTPTPSDAIRKYHLQNLALAMDRLEQVPMDRREYQSMTLAMNTERLPWFRQRLGEFLDEVNDELEAAPVGEVYTLAVQLFPVSQPKL